MDMSNKPIKTQTRQGISLGLSRPQNLKSCGKQLVLLFNGWNHLRYDRSVRMSGKLAIHPRINNSIGCFQRRSFDSCRVLPFVSEGALPINYDIRVRDTTAFRGLGVLKSLIRPILNSKNHPNPIYAHSHEASLCKWWKSKRKKEILRWLDSLATHCRTFKRAPGTWGCNKDWGFLWFQIRIYDSI